MSEVTLQQRLVYTGIEVINHIVERLPMAEAHEAISQLRAHLEARAEQTAPIDSEFSDLMGVSP